MANTEKMKVLQLVRETKNAIWDAWDGGGLDSAQESMMDKLYDDLDNLEDDLILSEISEHINKIRGCSKKLENVAKKIKKDIKKLKSIADKVDKVAKALKILVEIASKAGSLGVL
ncbi:MAG: hypothetical protein GY777_15840 [Candidatus Brocadiaceae bacterium]|nr:hypothetical protein [Candidatus Brocadiaceae bacterium]